MADPGHRSPTGVVAIAVIGMAFFAASTASALDKTISLGRDHMWSDLAIAEGTVLKPGPGGFPVLALRTDEYTPSASTDLLLHFNGNTQTDSAGNYRVTASSVTTSRKWARLGEGAAVFQGEQDGIELSPLTTAALFAPGHEWHDFTIEFWLYPATLSEGETVFLWQGARKDRGHVVPQSVRCDIEGSRLTWTLANLFRPTSGGELTVRLQGAEDLIPRTWHHHTLRFDAHTGMIEYLIDGTPEAIAYANNADRENGTVFDPVVGSAAESRITLGSELTGFLDEFRISSAFISNPRDRRYSSSPGTVVTRPIDLGYTDSVVSSISADDTKPGNTGVFYYYRSANVMTAPNELPAKWTQFAPGKPLPSPPSGKYIQFKIELLPGGSGELSPTVSDLSFDFKPRLPPSAPSFLTAIPGDGQVMLRWRKVVDPDLKGYQVFYGDRPEQYFGTDSSSGTSPVDVGNVTSFDVKGLKNGKLYFFSVVAYDSSTPPHLSAFSNQVAARPSTISGAGS